MSDDVEIIVDSPEPSQQRRPSDEDVDVISIDDDEPIATQEKHEDVSPTSGNKRVCPIIFYFIYFNIDPSTTSSFGKE